MANPMQEGQEGQRAVAHLGTQLLGPAHKRTPTAPATDPADQQMGPLTKKTPPPQHQPQHHRANYWAPLTHKQCNSHQPYDRVDKDDPSQFVKGRMPAFPSGIQGFPPIPDSN